MDEFTESILEYKSLNPGTIEKMRLGYSIEKELFSMIEKIFDGLYMKDYYKPFDCSQLKNEILFYCKDKISKFNKVEQKGKVASAINYFSTIIKSRVLDYKNKAITNLETKKEKNSSFEKFYDKTI